MVAGPSLRNIASLFVEVKDDDPPYADRSTLISRLHRLFDHLFVNINDYSSLRAVTIAAKYLAVVCETPLPGSAAQNPRLFTYGPKRIWTVEEDELGMAPLRAMILRLDSSSSHDIIDYEQLIDKDWDVYTFIPPFAQPHHLTLRLFDTYYYMKSMRATSPP